jgi:hypothetical protein
MKLRFRNPVPSGYLMRYSTVGRGGFQWPASRYRCEGYTSRGITVPCGAVFETQAGNPATRCEACRKAHLREWYRLKYLRRLRRKTRA